VNDAPTFTKGADQTVLEDATAQTVAAWATVISAGPPDESGQTLTFSTSSTNPSLFLVAPAIDASTGTLTYTPAANANGSAVVTVTLQDNGGTANGGVDQTTKTFTINVTKVNDAPVINAFAGPLAPNAVNTPITVTGNFTDVDLGDVPMTESHTVTIAWGDATSSTPTPTGTGTTLNISANHTYAAAGVYTVTLTVKDAGNLTDVEIYQYVVVYDPNAGFVTGGGWINSPAGAYAANPSLRGKATFGFVSKYKKGQSTPDGNTEFQFHAAGMNFKSSVYEWLVIAGAKSQFKGTGTIDGAGNYGFLLTAIDGQINGGGGADKFRIKIWDKNNGDAVVYDNQLLAADDANPTTLLGGGSINIQAK
jgi:PKD repeat protein